MKDFESIVAQVEQETTTIFKKLNNSTKIENLVFEIVKKHIPNDPNQLLHIGDRFKELEKPSKWASFDKKWQQIKYNLQTCLYDDAIILIDKLENSNKNVCM